MAFTFGAPSATPAPLFGAPAAKTQATAPLFGTTAPTAAPAPLFGSAPAATSTASSLFGAPSTAAAAPLFGATTAAPAPSLFGAAATSTAPSLFGASTATAAKPLFGATTTTAPAAGGLFGTAPTATATTGGLFGSTATATAAPSGGLFGSAAAPAASTGLGGIAGAGAAYTTGIAGSGVAKQDAQVENVREARLDQPIADLLAAVKKQLKENNETAEEFASSSSNSCLKIDTRVKLVSSRLAAITRRADNATKSIKRLQERQKIDLRLARQATKTQENAAKNNYAGAATQAQQYMTNLIVEYQDTVGEFNAILADLKRKVDDLKAGKPAIGHKALSGHLKAFDIDFTSVAMALSDAVAKISQLKSVINEVHPGLFAHHLFAPLPTRSTAPTRIGGDPALPSQAVALQIAGYLRQSGAPAPAAAGGGLFGAPATTSLFGAASTAPKPFSFGGTAAPSLFGATNPATSTAPSLFGATTAASTVTPNFPTFGKSISNNSSGLLFSSKPFGTK